MKQEYREAFTEVYEIFQLMPSELMKKIPSKFYNMIKEERKKEYYPNIKEPLEEQKLKDETVIILGLIYRDFLCSIEERKTLQAKDAKELQQLQKEMEEEIRRKYNPEDIFKKRENIEVEEEHGNCNNSLVVVEEKWYKRIFNMIKRLFNK